MADIFTKEKRSQIMSRIKSKNTGPERKTIAVLDRLGHSFALYVDDLPGKPDIVLEKYNTIFFVHGCFWHGHKNCKLARLPKTNRAFWKKKIENNQKRDRSCVRKLRRAGWSVHILWECRLKNEEKLTSRITNTLRRATPASRR